MNKYLLNNNKIKLFIIVAIAAALLGTGFSFVISNMLDLAQEGSNKKIIEFILFAVIYVLATVMFEWIFSFMKYVILKNIKLELKNDILNSIFKKNISEYEKNNTAFYLNEMTTKNDMITEMYFKNILSIPYYVFSFISAIIACVYLSWIMIAVMIGFGVLTVHITNKAGKRIEDTSKTFSDSLPLYTQKVKDYFEGIKVIKVFKVENLIENEHEKVNEILEDARLQNIRSIMLANYSGEIIGLMSTVLVTGIATALAFNGYITIGSVLAFSQLMGKIISPMSVFVDMKAQLKMVKPIITEVEELLYYTVHDEEYISEEIDTSIKFENVSFCYSNGMENVIEGCSFEINNKSKVLITGKSGSGKSTIAALLLKFYDNYKGKILIGGKDIRNLSYEKLYSKIGYLSQTPFIFEDTIKNNVSLFNSSITDEEIVSILEQVGLKTFLNSLPNGIETSLRDLGSNISGGEKQRICLARVLLLNKDILILDEFETGLDKETKDVIESIILSLNDKIIITISHDISDEHKRKYDIIYTVASGKVVA